MDALVEWMHESGPTAARKLFEQAVGHGVDSIPNAPRALRAFFEIVEAEPRWLLATINVINSQLNVIGVDSNESMRIEQVGLITKKIRVTVPDDQYDQTRRKGVEYTIRLAAKNSSKHLKVVVYDYRADVAGSVVTQFY